MQAIDKLPLIPAVFEFVGILFSGVRTFPCYPTLYHVFVNCSYSLLLLLAMPVLPTDRLLHFFHLCLSNHVLVCVCVCVCVCNIAVVCISLFALQA